MAGLPFHWHLPEVAVVAVVAAVFAGFHLRGASRTRAIVAVVAALAMVAWPVGDMASGVSLSVAVAQRLVIMLLVVPLLMMATPVILLDRVTRPRLIDGAVRRLSHPGFAIVVVTVLGTVTVSPTVIDWGARSELGHLVALALTVVAGIVLWVPGLAAVPGARRLSPTGRAGYIFVSSIVVTVLSFVWIFLRHPIYPDLHHQQIVLHISPLLDQQLAGFVAKFGAYGPMWIAAYRIFLRAEGQGVPVEETPLYWADVERYWLRVDRARARALRRHVPS
jgi:cytochrome c oxidase assembly factor CtaG